MLLVLPTKLESLKTEKFNTQSVIQQEELIYETGKNIFT